MAKIIGKYLGRCGKWNPVPTRSQSEYRTLIPALTHCYRKSTSPQLPPSPRHCSCHDRVPDSNHNRSPLSLSSYLPSCLEAIPKGDQERPPHTSACLPIATSILAVLQDHIQEFGKSCSGDVINKVVDTVLSTFSAAISGGVSLVSFHMPVNLSLELSSDVYL
jgi:hypothetical protein